MYATPENMKKCEKAGLRVLAYSPLTFEECSATSGDYFFLSPDEPLRDCEDEPMILVRRVVTFEEVDEEELER